MSRKRNKGLDRRGRMMWMMWMSIWLGGSLWSGLHWGNGVLTAVWHGFLTLAGCMGVYLLGYCIYIFPEISRHERERIRRERDEKEQRRRELYEELDRKYKGVELPDELLYPPRNPYDNTGCSGMVF